MVVVVEPPVVEPASPVPTAAVSVPASGVRKLIRRTRARAVRPRAMAPRFGIWILRSGRESFGVDLAARDAELAQGRLDAAHQAGRPAQEHVLVGDVGDEPAEDAGPRGWAGRSTPRCPTR